MGGLPPDHKRFPTWDAAHAEEIAKQRSAEYFVDARLVEAIPVNAAFCEPKKRVRHA